MTPLTSIHAASTNRFSGLLGPVTTSSSTGLLTGLAVSTAVLIPLKIASAYKAYDWQGFTNNDKRLLLTQEIARQATSTVLWMSSLAASWGISGRIVGSKQHLARFLSANLMASIVDSVARPFITAVATKRLLSWQGAPPIQVTPKQTSKFSTPPVWASGQIQPSTPSVQYVI